MIRLLSFLFTGCWHKWEIIETYNVMTRSVLSGANLGQCGTRYILQCGKCGNVKGKEIG